MVTAVDGTFLTVACNTQHMADLLPSTPDTSAADEAAPRVVGLDDEAADDTLAALSSTTAREILQTLHEEPAPASDLADRVDTSLQNTQYHLENLSEADLVEVIDTVYSEKGREMDIYAPTDRPLVVVAGDDTEVPTLRSLLMRFFGAIAVVALASVIVQTLVGDLGSLLGTQSADGGDDVSIESTPDGGDITADAATTAADVAAGLPPGLLFFAGGVLTLLITLGYTLWRRRD